MLFNIALLIIGLFVLILGGDALVRGASSIALRLHMTPLVVGLTIVAFGTSAPELLISINAAISGSPDLTMGNVVGSNICNLALVLGITLIIGPVKVQGDSIRIDWPMTFGSSLLLFFVTKDLLLGWQIGIFFLFLLFIYTFFIIRRSRIKLKKAKAEEAQLELDLPAEASSNSMWRDIGLIAVGSLALFFGSDWFVTGAKELASFLGVSQRVIGITVLALGTSLPELVTAIVASFKRETDLALGNLLGSNIFNVLSILGITSIIQTIDVNSTIRNVDMLWMLGITLLVLPMMLLRNRLGRIDGVILLLIYIYYTYSVIS
jgi:cation:H+ antiporter